MTKEVYESEIISEGIAKVTCTITLSSLQGCNRQKIKITVLLKWMKEAWSICHVHSSLCFDTEFIGLTPFLSRQHVMTVMIEKAIQNNELLLYVQPQFDIMTKEVVSGEVLLRWQSESGNIISPERFLPLLEKERSMKVIDFFVLRRLCSTLAKWRNENRDCMRISINQSACHFINLDTEYLKTFVDIVDQYEIPHELIVFELTESVFFHGSEDVMKAFRFFRKLGFRLSLDDFGSGYASMNILHLLQPDELKIDKSLSDGMDGDPGSKVIIRKIIEMAHELHMDVVCEGIETEDQLKFLKQVSCDKGQGYLVCRPIPIEEFAQAYL